MQTPYGALSYQTPTRNCKPLKTQLCALRLAAHEIQTLNTYNHETKVLPMDIHLKLYATQLKQLTQTLTYPFHDLNAYSDPPRNMKATIIHNSEHITSLSQN